MPCSVFGRIIGFQGKNIKDITEQNNVSISLGKFVETKKKGQDTSKETSGSLITGKVSNTTIARKRMMEARDSADEQDTTK